MNIKKNEKKSRLSMANIMVDKCDENFLFPTPKNQKRTSFKRDLLNPYYDQRKVS